MRTVCYLLAAGCACFADSVTGALVPFALAWACCLLASPFIDL